MIHNILCNFQITLLEWSRLVVANCYARRKESVWFVAMKPNHQKRLSHLTLGFNVPKKPAFEYKIDTPTISRMLMWRHLVTNSVRASDKTAFKRGECMTEFIQHIPTIGEVAKMANVKSNLILVVVLNHLKDISQNGDLPQFAGWK